MENSMNLLAFYIYLIDVLSDHPFRGLATLSLLGTVITLFGTAIMSDFSDSTDQEKVIT
ncbi:hypothetical protein VPNG_00115 [Vibrio phage VBP47]|uniref:Uncharacterized protein n=1 Tax=Vibrio phage VBP47 TaxID=754073 RepID=M4T2T2_9CAUD|nr:hypothetical protein VPNG_00115 [Vibrio phage VBP47]AGH57139.1 hypothetical protein VPNG_00115 [Vibrio phage VBP47]